MQYRISDILSWDARDCLHADPRIISGELFFFKKVATRIASRFQRCQYLESHPI